MTRFCTKCGNRIADEKRVRRGSHYCSEGCRREARRENRTLLAQKRCRLCGRMLRPRNTPPEAPAPCAPGAQLSAEEGYNGISGSGRQGKEGQHESERNDVDSVDA